MWQALKHIFWRRNLHVSIRMRLMFFFVFQVSIILLAAGVYLNWQLRLTLEDQLADTLESVAASIAVQIESDYLQSFLPGDESSRTYRTIRRKLIEICRATGMKRIYAFRRDGTNLIDTRPGMPIGGKHIRLQFNEQEIRRVVEGRTASSVLFQGNDDQFYKSGFAPILRDSVVIGAIGVDGSARTLVSIREIQRNLTSLGVMGILISLVLAFFFARRITTPLKKLERAARAIGQGNFADPIRAQGRDEVAFLGQTLEEMRRGILQRDQRQTMMLAGVAHEIRNPLGGIELFAGLLRDDLPEGDQRSAAEKILREVRNLKNITQGFLDWARPKVAHKENVRVRDIFNEAASLLGREADSANLEYSEQPENIGVNADPQHLKQIFINLIQNAIQATPSNCLVQIRAQFSDDDSAIAITFQDNGPGIPDAIQPQIFEPFFTTREKGTGLGLAVVKNLVEENGGRIELIESSAAGSVFAIVLQLPTAESGAH